MARSYLSLITMIVFYAYAIMIQVAPSVIAFDLMREFKVTALALGVLILVGNLAFGLSEILSGSFLDRLGIQKIVPLSIFITTCGILCFSLANSFSLLLLGRIIALFGCGTAWVGIALIAMHKFDRKNFVLIIAIAQLAYTVGAILGESFFGFILTLQNWHALHIQLALIGGVLAILSLLFLKDGPFEKEEKVESIDCMSGLAIILKKNESWQIILYATASWSPMVIFSAFWGIPFIMVKFRLSAVDAANLMMLTWIGYGVGNLILGYISRFLENSIYILLWGSFLGAIFISAILWQPYIPINLLRIYLLGIGVSCSTNLFVYAMIRNIVPKSVAALSQGVLNIFPGLLGVLISPLVGVLLNAFWDKKTFFEGTPLYSVGVFQIALAILPILLFLGWYVAYFHLYKIARQKA